MPKEEQQPKQLNLLQQADNFLARFQRIPNSEKIFFVKHLSTMLKSGISLAKALEGLGKQIKNKRLQGIIKDIAHKVEKGQTMASALKDHENVFGELFVSMVDAGEISGQLEEVLAQLHVQLKKDHQLLAKVRGALMYPIVIFVAMVGIGIGVMTFVVPKMLGIFEGVNMELPLMTRVLITISDAFVEHGLLVAAGFIIVVVGVWRILKTKMGKHYWHFIVLRIPIIGSIVKKINLARFARTMSAMLKTDIKIVKSFAITSNTVGNVHYRNSLKETAENVKKGQQINELLGKYPDLYSDMILQMISVGEETGKLDSILDELANFYEDEVNEIMNSLPSIIEPLIILILATVIGAMAIAIIMPMYSLTNAI